MFIYSFIYSVTSFPVESWVSMPYEHREKPTKIYILYVSTHDTSVSLGHTFWVSLSCQPPPNSFHLCWTSGPVLVG